MNVVFVDDFDDLVAQTSERGLEPTARETYGNGVRKAAYQDPEGNKIEFGDAPIAS
ncbi:MAG TPA: VOC family protein [Verrucomicrobiae bacterium]|nr:VOC family protein [Verrucomicrobiae bacterium]